MPRFGPTTSAMAVLLAPGVALAGDPAFVDPWPNTPAIQGEAITLPSHSPFHLSTPAADAEPTDVPARLFLPPEASADRPVPGVVLVHGSSGVQSAREITYARQFAAQGVAAIVIDSFAARRDRATSFVDRLIEITETMMLADAFAALRWLDELPEVDGSRVALMGFSYGGLVATLAAFEQVPATLAPEGHRFAAHVAFYPPCIVRFEDVTATGAPLLILLGELDEITDPEDCNAIADDLVAGGAEAEAVVLEGAMHLWDGSSAPRPIGRHLRDCAFRVRSDGQAEDVNSPFLMDGPLTRRAILALCVGGEPYWMGRDDEVRALSNALVAELLGRALAAGEGL